MSKSKFLGDLKNVSSVLSQKTNKTNAGNIVDLDINLISPDPNQPRKDFNEEELNSLADSISFINPRTSKPRGVKQAITVRPNPEKKGYYIIIMGERRYRASIIAKMPTIKAYIENDINEEEISDDQMIENIQKSDLKPKEIANWIGKQLAKGRKKGELAKTLGKSNAFITQYAALLALPIIIGELFDSGKCSDVTLLNDLSTLHKKNPNEVDNWIKDNNQEINRDNFKLFKEFLNQHQQGDENESHSQNDESVLIEKENDKESKPTKITSKLSKAIIMIEHQGMPGRLVINKRPSSDTMGWIKYDENGEDFEVKLKDLLITSIIEG